jgi:hypothetical protein
MIDGGKQEESLPQPSGGYPQIMDVVCPEGADGTVPVQEEIVDACAQEGAGGTPEGRGPGQFHRRYR